MEVPRPSREAESHVTDCRVRMKTVPSWGVGMSLSREVEDLVSVTWRGCTHQVQHLWGGRGMVSHGRAPRRHADVKLLLLFPDSSWQWQSIDGAVVLPVLPASLRELTQQYDLCVTGEGLSHLQSVNRQQLLKLIPHIQVFARVVPKQKVRDFSCW